MTENLLSTPPSPEITNPLYIEQDNKKYLLVIKISGDSMSFIASEPEKKDSLTYLRKMTLNEIKEKETKNLFMGINSCMEFYDYLKVMSDMKKLSIIQKEDKLTISFTVDYLFKKHTVDINLFSEKINIDSISDLYKEVITLKEKIKNITSSDNNNDLKKEIDNLKDEIKELKIIIEPIVKKFNDCININKYIFNNKSMIMKENEIDFIHLAIKSRMNKHVKELKKLYQASIDGDGAINFHSKCDNIPNTLVFIKSKGNRRFGGFASETWESKESGEYKDDKNAFLFSLDKQKIYSYTNDGKAMFNDKNSGPHFEDIRMDSYFIQEKKLTTYESYLTKSYNYYEDYSALSESGNNAIYTDDCEVFEVIFE